MNTTVQVPVNVTAEAMKRIAELGIQAQIEAMIEHTGRAVPGLESIEISEEYSDEEGGPPLIALTAWCTGQDPNPWALAPLPGWWQWFYETFSPEVMRWVSPRLEYWGDHGR